MSTHQENGAPVAAVPRSDGAHAAPATRVVARNIIWIWVATAADMGVGFVLAPFLVNRLGVTGYGIWLLITSLSSYLLLLDLGVRSSVGRYIALHNGRDDQFRVNTTVSTAVAIWCGMAVVVLAAIAVAELAFFEVFAVPDSWLGEARVALLVVGVQLALKLPLEVFGAVFYGFQRFDLSNLIQVGHACARGLFTVLAINFGLGLPGLACVLLLAQLLAGVACLMLLHRVNPGLRVRPGLVRRDDARELMRFGAWNSVLAVGRLITPTISPALIGVLLGIAWVTVFSLTARLIAIAVAALGASTAVLTPLVAHWGARAEEDRQQTLFVVAGKYSWLVALYLCVLLILLGGPFLGLWIGPELARAAPLLTVLALGELLPFSQHATSSVILGLARHRRLALLTIVEAAGVVLLALVLVGPYGLIGMGYAVALPGLVCRGLVPLLYGCRLLQVPLRRYVRQALLPAIAPALVASAGLAAATQWRTPTTWSALLLYVAGYSVCFGMVCLAAPGWSELRIVVRARLSACLSRVPPDVGVPLHSVAPVTGPHFGPALTTNAPLAQDRVSGTEPLTN